LPSISGFGKFLGCLLFAAFSSVLVVLVDETER